MDIDLNSAHIDCLDIAAAAAVVVEDMHSSDNFGQAVRRNPRICDYHRIGFVRFSNAAENVQYSSDNIYKRTDTSSSKRLVGPAQR